MISKFIKNQLKNALVLGALLTCGNMLAQLGLTWTEMGPNDIGGRTRSLLIDKMDATSKTIYAGSVSGGIFKSTNSGASWAPINDQAASLIVSSMAQASDGSIYFGTGETFGRGGDGAGSSGFRGTGLYKLNPSTASITLVKDSATFGNINEVALDNSNNIYVASDKGLFYSSDGGATFTKETISGTAAAMDVKISNGGDVYFAAGTKDTKTGKVYRKDFGNTSFVLLPLPSASSFTNVGRIEIAIAPSDPNYVYLSIARQRTVSATASGGGELCAFLVSDTKGSSWSSIALTSSQTDPMILGTAGFGDYANAIAVDPANKTKIYIGSESFYSWTQLPSNPLGQGTWSEVAFTSSPINFPFYVHSKIHDFKFDLVNPTLYIATDAGVYKSISSNTGFLSFNNGLNIAQYNSVTFPIYPRVNQGTPTNVAVPYAGVAGGTQGNSLTYLPGNLNTIQTSNSFGSSNAYQSDFSKLSPKSIFYAGAFGTVFRNSNIEISAFSSFYDTQYNRGGNGLPGSSTFANENTPMRLWENYKTIDSMIFFNEVIKTEFNNTNASAKTFTILNTRPQASAKYDTIIVRTSSSKKKFGTLITKSTYTNSNVSATTFTTANTRTHSISKYDSVVVKMVSFKMLPKPTYTSTNTNTVVTTFTIANTRPFATMKYDTIHIETIKTGSVITAPSKSITIIPKYTYNNITGYSVLGSAGALTNDNKVFLNSSLNDSLRFTFDSNPDTCYIQVRIIYGHRQSIDMVPAYTGSVVTGMNITGEANTSAATNNTVNINQTTLSDDVVYTFIDAPRDSSIISIRLRNVYYQTLKFMPVYTGTAVTGYTEIGETNTAVPSNFAVFLNNSLADSLRFTFRLPIEDSCTVASTIKLRYDAGAVITMENKDISGQTFTTTTTLPNALNSTANATVMPTAKLPLKRSARLAVGTSAKTSDNPNIYVVKRPLDFATNPDWVKIAGKNSRVDGPGGVASNSVSPVLGSTVTRLEWANNGNYIYFVTKEANGSAYYLYRISHLEFIGDSASADYSGIFCSDIDSLRPTPPVTILMAKKPSQRTTALGKFNSPITSISISNDDKSLLITCGAYTNNIATVYMSNSDITTMSMNNTNSSNFTAKNGTGLPLIPAYSSLFEMTDNKRVLVGTESGLYSTTDITAGSPVWAKESAGFPNVPVFQLRQQTFPSYQCYNNGIIYAATHGRGLWSTDKYAVPYAIGIEENEVKLSANENLKLYPNPAADATNVLFTAQGDANYRVVVYDISGRILMQETTGKLMGGENTVTLNTASLNSGVYFVTINGSNNFNGTSKLVITR